jgi:cytochrome bd-type quinol oxidase subunit 2
MMKSVKSARIILLLSAAAFVFYLLAYIITKDVYRYPIVGAICEMLWLPMLMSLAVLPVLSLIILARNRDVPWIYPVISIVFNITGAQQISR